MVPKHSLPLTFTRHKSSKFEGSGSQTKNHINNEMSKLNIKFITIQNNLLFFICVLSYSLFVCISALFVATPLPTDCCGGQACLWVAERARTPFRTPRACTHRPGSDPIWIPVRISFRFPTGIRWILIRMRTESPSSDSFKPEQGQAPRRWVICPVSRGLLWVAVLVFGLLCRHTASNSITTEMHTSGAQ